MKRRTIFVKTVFGLTASLLAGSAFAAGVSFSQDLQLSLSLPEVVSSDTELNATLPGVSISGDAELGALPLELDVSADVSVTAPPSTPNPPNPSPS